MALIRPRLIAIAALTSPAHAEEPAPRPGLEIAASVVYVAGNVTNMYSPTSPLNPIDGYNSGLIASAEIGRRFTRRYSVGAHLSLGTLTGTYALKVFGNEYDRAPYGLVPIDAGGFLHVMMVEQIWAGFLVGVHADGTRFDGEFYSWSTGVGVGLEVGYDPVHFDTHWLTVCFRAAAAYGNDIGYGSIGVGLGYHH